VQPLRTQLLPAQSGPHGVAELATAAGNALDELDGPAVGDVDSREQLERWEVVGHEGLSSVGDPGGSACLTAAWASAPVTASAPGLLVELRGGAVRFVVGDRPVADVVAVAGLLKVALTGPAPSSRAG
jgi:hypothetical protein